MPNHALPALALLVALAALVHSLLAGGSEREAAAVAPPSPSSELVARVEALERSLAELAARPAPLAARPAAPTEREPVVEAVGADELAELRVRVAALERSGSTDPGSVERRVREEERALREQQDVEASLGIALDPTASEEDRLLALGRLRHSELADGSDARTPEVVDAMILLAETTADPAVRADVFRQLHRSGDPALKGPLLVALASDPSAEVRSEAAETLGDYLDDPAVVAALETAKAYDVDEDVREQADESLDEAE